MSKRKDTPRREADAIVDLLRTRRDELGIDSISVGGISELLKMNSSTVHSRLNMLEYAGKIKVQQPEGVDHYTETWNAIYRVSLAEDATRDAATDEELLEQLDTRALLEEGLADARSGRLTDITDQLELAEAAGLGVDSDLVLSLPRIVEVPLRHLETIAETAEQLAALDTVMSAAVVYADDGEGILVEVELVNDGDFGEQVVRFEPYKGNDKNRED